MERVKREEEGREEGEAAEVEKIGRWVQKIFFGSIQMLRICAICVKLNSKSFPT